MQALFASRGGARKTAPTLHTTIFKFMQIGKARNLVRNAIGHAHQEAEGDADLAERLILHKLTQNDELQAGTNRLMVAMLMRDAKFAPIATKTKLLHMQTAAKELHGLILELLEQNDLQFDAASTDIFNQLAVVKDHLKDARKAVA